MSFAAESYRMNLYLERARARGDNLIAVTLSGNPYVTGDNTIAIPVAHRCGNTRPLTYRPTGTDTAAAANEVLALKAGDVIQAGLETDLISNYLVDIVVISRA